MLYTLDPEGTARPVPTVRAQNEASELQTVLARNLNLLPGDQIDPESPRRWLLIREEMPVPDPGGGGSRWSVDLLLTDQSGIPTFVECKRYADTRSRREVVGQMLEYAANGHHYWDRSEIRRYIEETSARVGRSVEQRFAELTPDDFEDLDDLLERFIENLREGQVRLVFFMEEAPQELKSIVDFLNRQTERSEILIVEARQFEDQGRRYILPSLFGYTEEARRAKRSVHVETGQKRRTWNEEEFMAELARTLGGAEAAAVRRIYDTAREAGLEIRWGTGVKRGSFSLVLAEYGPRSFASFLTDGEMWINLPYLERTPEGDRFRAELARRLTEEVGLEAKGGVDDYWLYKVGEWVGRADELVPLVLQIRS